MSSSVPGTEQAPRPSFQGKLGLHGLPEIPPAHAPGKEGPATALHQAAYLGLPGQPQKNQREGPGMANKQAWYSPLPPVPQVLVVPTLLGRFLFSQSRGLGWEGHQLEKAAQPVVPLLGHTHPQPSCPLLGLPLNLLIGKAWTRAKVKSSGQMASPAWGQRLLPFRGCPDDGPIKNPGPRVSLPF